MQRSLRVMKTLLFPHQWGGRTENTDCETNVQLERWFNVCEHLSVFFFIIVNILREEWQLCKCSKLETFKAIGALVLRSALVYYCLWRELVYRNRVWRARVVVAHRLLYNRYSYHYYVHVGVLSLLLLSQRTCGALETLFESVASRGSVSAECNLCKPFVHVILSFEAFPLHHVFLAVYMHKVVSDSAV